MNLVIDIGNSRTKFSVFNRGEMIITVPVEKFGPEDLKVLQKEYPSLKNVILSSVKKYSSDLKNYIQKYFDCFIELNETTPLPLENCYQSKETLGKDRIAAAVGGSHLYPNSNLLIIDAGTAITYDIVNDKNQYLGGNISPGLEMRFKALNQFTGELPLLQSGKFDKLYGKTTNEAILAGVQNGFVFEVDKAIETFKEFYNNLKVIITGGDANFFDMKLKNSFFVHFNLIAIGLNRILEYNGRFSKVIILAGMILAPVLLLAQFNNNTTSPYSRYGLGDLHPYSFGRTTAMGGAAFASRNAQQINAANPASYTSVDSLAFLFEFGVIGKLSNFSNDISSMNANDINFRYFAMSFQIKNWLATSLGLTPYSDVGYDVEVTQSADVVGEVLHKYYGTGSLSKAYWGVALDPVENISLGLNLNYIFGSLTQSAEQYALQVSGFDNLQKYENIRLRDFGLTFGFQGTLPVKENDRLTLGVVLESKPKYTALYSDLTRKYVNATSGYDTLNVQNEEKASIEFPLTLGLGLSYVKENKLEINVDYYQQAWSKAKFNDPMPEELSDHLTNLNKFALGAEWIPNRFSIGSYLNKIAYRAGLKYEDSYLELNGKQINDFGISFGVGLPVYRSSSTINVSAEIGRRGTKQNNLVLERYAKLNLSVNMYDVWFIKRRYD